MLSVTVSFLVSNPLSLCVYTGLSFLVSNSLSVCVYIQVQQVDNQQTPAMAAVASMLQRFSQMHHNPNECAIYPAVRELMTNLVIPVTSQGGV